MQTKGGAPVDERFDRFRPLVRRGLAEYTRMTDGQEVRVWRFSNGQWNPTTWGRDLFQSSPTEIVVQVPVDLVGVGNREWSKGEEWYPVSDSTVPGLSRVGGIHPRNVNEIKRMVLEKMDPGTFTERVAGNQVVERRIGAEHSDVIYLLDNSREWRVSTLTNSIEPHARLDRAM